MYICKINSRQVCVGLTFIFSTTFSYLNIKLHLRYRYTKSIGIIYGSWYVVKESDAASNYRHFSRKYWTTSILPGTSLIRRHPLPLGYLRISNANIIPRHGRISINHFSTSPLRLTEKASFRVKRYLYMRNGETFFPRQGRKYFTLLSISSCFKNTRRR